MYNNLKNKNLALFLGTYDSFELWNKVGILNREMELYNRMAKHFDNIYIFTYGSKKDIDFQHIVAPNITILPKTLAINDYIYQFLIPFVYRKILKKCHIYKTNQNIAAIPAILSKLFFRNKLIIRSGFIGSLNAKVFKQGKLLLAYLKIIEYVSYKICDVAFQPTYENCSYLLQTYNSLNYKILQLNNFIQTDLFKPINIESKQYDLLYVARFDTSKNHLLLLEAIKNNKYKICFVGGGEMLETAKFFASENNVNVQFIAKVDNRELVNYYNKSKLYVFPSAHEGNPKTLLEAMSCQMPVIGCNVPGVKNIIQHNISGILCEPTVESLRNTILSLINDETLQKKLADNARNFIVENYDIDKLLAKELSIYSKLLNNEKIVIENFDMVSN